MLLGLIRPTAGTATIGGVAYHDIANPLTVVGSALESTNFHPGRSGRDHLRVLAAASGIPVSRVDEMLELVGIPAAARKRARRLLDGYAPAARPRGRPARRPEGGHPRRAGQRPRPRGHPLAARLPAVPRPARARPSSSRATCSRRSPRPSTTWSSSPTGAASRRARSATCRASRPCWSGPPTATSWPAPCRARVERTGQGRRHPVTTEDMARIGDVALRAGVAVHELRRARPTSRALLRADDAPRTATATSVARCSPRRLPPPTGPPDRRRACSRRPPTRRHRTGAATRTGGVAHDPVDQRRSSSSSSPPGCGGAWRIAIVLAGAAFALLFGFIFTSDAGAARAAAAGDHQRPRPGPPGVHRRHRRRLPAHPGHRRHDHRLGVPPQDGHLDVPRRRPSGSRSWARRSSPLLVIGAMYGVLSLVGSVVTGATPAHRQGPRAVRGPGDLADPRPGPARARPLGAHRSRGRHPHPQPGRRTAHRDRRRLDHRADPRSGPRHHQLGQTSRRTCPARPRRRCSTRRRRFDGR